MRAETAERAGSDRPGPIRKVPTGITGFDLITGGGLPAERTTLVVGGPGTGKTVFALQALVNGATLEGEPGIFVAMEETTRQIIQNAATFGWDLPRLERERLFFLDAHLSPTTVRTGEFDLSATLAALSHKVAEMGAKRVVFDGLDVLLTLLDDPVLERREVYRIQEWLLERELTGIITAKSTDSDRSTAERYAFLQFMVDCMVLLQHRLVDRVSLRTLRVTKYRGTAFRESEFPMVVASTGIDVATFGEAIIDYPVFSERVSTGVPRLDTMLAGGYFRASCTLVSGAPGTAKTTLGGAFVEAASQRGERALYISFDEPADQIARNLASVGIELAPQMESGRLVVHGVRTEVRGAEQHLLELKNQIQQLRPRVLVLDPISALAKTGGQLAATHTAIRLIDFAKAEGLTILCTSLVNADDQLSEATSLQISTIADTWIHLSYSIHGGERNRLLTVVKSRGTKHSHQVRELVLSDEGLDLADVYAAGGEVLAGTARWEREAAVREAEERRRRESRLELLQLNTRESSLAARIAELQRELELSRAQRRALESDEQDRRQYRFDSETARLRLRDADRDTMRLTSDPHDPGKPASG
jgi:circadian clock protein KaiC